MSAGWLEPLARCEALEPLRSALDAGGGVSVAGPVAAARLLLPLLLSERPLLVVVPRERDLEAATEDLRTLARELGQPGEVLAAPAPGPPPFRGLPRHGEASLQRARVLHAAGRGRLRAVVASPAGLLRPVLAPRFFETRVLEIRRGDELTPEMLLEALDEAGYRREDPVGEPGELARRGGILDVFPPALELPVRLEFFGDSIESLRSFDPVTQRSRAALESLEIVPLADVFLTASLLRALRDRLQPLAAGRPALQALLERVERGFVPEALLETLPLVEGAVVPLWDYLPQRLVTLLAPESVRSEAAAYVARAREDASARAGEQPVPEPERALVGEAALAALLQEAPRLQLREVDTDGDSRQLSCLPVPRYAGDLARLAADLRAARGRSVLFLGNRGRAERLRDVLVEDGLAPGEGAALELRVGTLSQGFEWTQPPLRVLADGDIFPEEVHVHLRPRGRGARGFLSDFRDLRRGDLVVHQDHGIGRYEGLETLAIEGAQREFLVLAYQGGDRLKVPVEAFDRVQKYASAEAGRPGLDRLGSGQWDKVKRRVRKAMREMASELLALYAERKARPGHAFSGDSPWLREFEAAFDYEETPDQAAAIRDVAADMAAAMPMDRLICGDVGYGKTEVAMRAAMQAVIDGKQVALLAPTTVLAFQHWKTFRKRFAPFPVRIELVSRFRSAREIRATLGALAEGKVDVVIGTHRLLSKDVVFRDLGLVVIDEEQRFGVAAKEKLKQLRRSVDCLTLSATPIPRTLQMGLTGVRDMSVIETPPKDRLAIQTSIVRFSTDTIAAAIRQELGRDGQAYVVHNRVESIYSLAGLVKRLVPEARVVVAHGQLPETQLEQAMLAFVEGRADVLVATTIIENGLDIPRVNTLLVNRADRFGLAQLYQLRGRVGRSDRRAYAYLLVPPDTVLSELAQKRLAAIRDFSELGAGFRIAALDLELRGAGNLLGGQQSGHIAAVGLDLYVKLLEQTMRELGGEEAAEPSPVSLNLRIDLRIPPDYVPEAQQRMALYKRLSGVTSGAEIERLREEIQDRYGPLPQAAASLLAYATLRQRAQWLGIQQVDRTERALLLRPGPQPRLRPERLVALVQATPGAAASPDGLLRFPLAPETTPLEALARLLERLEQTSAPGEAEAGRL